MSMYVITHKSFSTKNLPVDYVPLLVGANKKDNPDHFLTDNTGINISDKNSSFCELTGLYWLLNNQHDKNIGISHYRRFFSPYNNKLEFYLSILISGSAKPISIYKLNSYLKNGFEWVVAKRESGGEGVLWDQYAYNHHIKDMEIVRSVIKNLQPDYLSDFDYIMKNTEQASFYNMFYTTNDEFKKYGSWLFNILFEVEKRVDISNYDSYQQRLFGFLGERLMNVWLFHRSPKVKYLFEYNSDEVGRDKALKKVKKVVDKI